MTRHPGIAQFPAHLPGPACGLRAILFSSELPVGFGLAGNIAGTRAREQLVDKNGYFLSAEK